MGRLSLVYLAQMDVLRRQRAKGHVFDLLDVRDRFCSTASSRRNRSIFPCEDAAIPTTLVANLPATPAALSRCEWQQCGSCDAALEHRSDGGS